MPPSDSSKLQTERDHYVAFAFCWADALVELEADHSIAFAAGALGPLVGRDPEELIGEDFDELVATQDRARMNQLLKIAQSKGRLEDTSVRLQGPRGTTPRMAMAAHSLDSRAGRFSIAFRLRPTEDEQDEKLGLQRDEASGLLDSESFGKVVEQKLESFKQAGTDVRMTVMSMPQLKELQERLGGDQNESLMHSVGAFLKANSADGDTAARVDDQSFSLIHEAAADIEALEQDHIVDPSERPWELRGEVQGKDRPRNSLLGLDATWDGVSKDPPPLDAAFGLKIEEVIKERVLAQNFDDIVPQTVVEQAYRERRSGKVEDQDDGALGQKSKLGLSEEYERDYVERQENGEKSDKPVRDEALDEKWRKLASRLDALSHFASPLERPALDEEVVAARTKASAVQLEEATPAAHTSEEGLAPEEVRAKKRGREELQRSQEEATRDERKAQRLAKKKARNAKRKKLRADARIVAKVAPDLKNPYEAKRVVRRVQQAEGGDQGKYGRSGKFFEQLQEEVRREVRGDAAPAPKKKRPARASAAKLG